MRLPTKLLKLNYYEAGFLYGALHKTGEFKNLPRALQLKLDIIFTSAYLNDNPLSKRARKDIRDYRKELKTLTG